MKMPPQSGSRDAAIRKAPLVKHMPDVWKQPTGVQMLMRAEDVVGTISQSGGAVECASAGGPLRSECSLRSMKKEEKWHLQANKL